MDANNIVDLSGVSPQQTFLESHPEKPSATSTLYIKRFTTKNADGSQNQTVVGVHIVLAKDDPNGLWEALHVDRATQKLDPQDPKVATCSLEIYCDTLEVHGELSVPEGAVSLFARRLVWATADAAINTSPLPWAVPKAQDASGSDPAHNGTAGRNAGSFKLFVSEVEPANDSRPRLVAQGGRGQDPGGGRNGAPGRCLEQHWPSLSFSAGLWPSEATANFAPVAVYVKVDHITSGVPVRRTEYFGEDLFPTDGTSALAPGIPGNGGNGGSLTTTRAGSSVLDTSAGKAGQPGLDYKGGAPGTPTPCAKYQVTVTETGVGILGAVHPGLRVSTQMIGNPATTAYGADAKARVAKDGEGGSITVVDQPNAWLHPLGLQKALEYARDLFLAGDRVEAQDLLCAYEKALALPMPNKTVWNDSSAAQWTAGQSEVAAMLQRLRGHLDYFGNAAGYTPLLSLQGTIKLYAEETQRALRTLLLVRWIDAKERDAKEATGALGEAIISLNEDTQQAATQVASSGAKASEVISRIDALEQKLNDMSNQLETLRIKLLSQAQGDLEQQAEIKFAIKMAAAVCQVVPVGQPALGIVGSLASVATDFIGGDGRGAPDTGSKLRDVLTKARDATKKAEEASEKADKEKGSAPAKDAQSAKARASAWAQVGDGLGPALSQVSQGLQALQVPRSEVEAELQRLESESEEWKKLVHDIRDLNERKAAFVSDLVDAFQSLGEGYARVSSNTAAVFTMQEERARVLGKLDPVATGLVQQMGQRSRLTLLRYLYLMVKAYETTILKSLSVDWKLSEVTDKINDLLEPEGGFDAAALDRLVNATLEPLYQKNLDTVRNQLLDDFSFNESTITLQLGLSSQQTPDIVSTLNESGEVVVDPVAYGLVLPDQQLARLSHVALKKLEFDPAGPPLPETHNVVVSVQPAHSGTIRKAEALYSVYSDSPLKWSWTVASGEVRASEPSKGAEDMLNLVLGSGAEKIKQKVSLPPIWSDLAIKVLYSPATFPMNQIPHITRLYFEFSCDCTSAPDHQRVLNVQSLGPSGGAVIQCSPDLANRGNGFDRMIRIYPRGASVRVSVPSHVAASAFDAWDLVGRQINQIGVKHAEVDIKLDDHVIAQCHWTPLPITGQRNLLSRTPAPADMAERAESDEGEGTRAESKVPLSAVAPVRDLLIRAEASEGASVVARAPTLNDAELVEEGEGGWKRVNYRGIVGWLNA